MKGVWSSIRRDAGRISTLSGFLAIVFLVSASGAVGAVLRVKPDGNDGNDGSTWGSAKQTVQAGLNAALPDDEVWVAAGVYVEQITLMQGVGLYGGFAGVEILREERNWTTNVTVLDGNGGGSVVTAPEGATATTRVDGFTVRNGSAYNGGGIFCYASSPTIANNTITANTAAYGGGVYCSEASPVISGNTIEGNSASEGGGVYCFLSSVPLITNSIIRTNNAQYGGGVSCWYCSPTVADCIINGNSALYNGGGIDCGEASPVIANTTMVGNTASDCGGGICCESNSSPLIANTIVAFNNSGIWNDLNFPGSPVLLHNCVYNPGGYDYFGVSPGAGDNQVDPLFANLPAGDYHLTPPSPCHDAGDNSVVQPGWVDLDGQSRILGMHVDIGVDEIYSDALPVLICADRVVSAGADCTTPCPDVVASVIDDCAPLPVITQVPPIGTPLPLGTTLVQVTLTDACGRSISCMGSATVADTTAPVRYGLGYIIITNDDFSCSARADFPCPAVDNCALASCVCTPPSGTTFPVGTNTVAVTATDATGNTATFDFQVIVVDDELPVISCPADKTLECSESTDPANTGWATATDNCDPAPVVTHSDTETPGSCPQNKTITRTWTATDESGNRSSCTQEIQVEDTRPPRRDCRPQFASCVDNCVAECPSIVDDVSDDCDPNPIVTQDPPVGTLLNWRAEPYPVTATISDHCGNVTTCTEMVTVIDTAPPVITCTNSTIAAGGDCTAPCPMVATATDNCPGVVVTQNPAVDTPLPIGTTTVTATATDASGNSAVCTATVTVTGTTISRTLPAGCWYMLSLPCDPVDPNPEAVFPPGTPLDGNLTRYDGGGYIAYYSFDPESFGPMQAGVGYWILAEQPIVISYGACCLPGEQEITLPYAGWYMMGSHQQEDVPVASVSVRNNGTAETLPFEQAWTSGWIQDPLFAYSCADLSYTSCGVDFSDQDDHLRQYKGYWFNTLQPNLTLIVP